MRSVWLFHGVYSSAISLQACCACYLTKQENVHKRQPRMFMYIYAWIKKYVHDSIHVCVEACMNINLAGSLCSWCYRKIFSMLAERVSEPDKMTLQITLSAHIIIYTYTLARTAQSNQIPLLSPNISQIVITHHSVLVGFVLCASCMYIHTCRIFVLHI